MLQGVQLAAFAQAFDGSDSLARCCPQGRVACRGRMAVDQDEACAALAAAAAEARTFQPKVVAERVEKRRVRTRLELGFGTVDGEPEALGHGCLRSSENLRVYPNRPSPPRISRLAPTSGYPAPGIFRILPASCA